MKANDTQTLADLGFRPALLDYATMSIYGAFDGLEGSPRLTLIAGFERNGFFSTRSAAAQAASAWDTTRLA